jgi:hypothetical protein
MKTPTLLFSLPFLITALAATPVSSQSDTSLKSADSESNSASVPRSGTGKSSDTTQPADAGATAPLTTPAETTAPSRPPTGLGDGGVVTLRIRGERRALEVATDRFHVRRKDGRQAVVRLPLPAARKPKEIDREAVIAEASTGERADIVAYYAGRPKTDPNKLLITRRVCLKMAEGITHSAFARSVGALHFERFAFAPDALVLTYASADEAVEASERLMSVPGVLSAEVVVASQHIPEFIPTDSYFSGGGPAYQPPPQTDNVMGWQCLPFLCDIIPTSGYQWWANNIGTPKLRSFRMSPRRPTRLSDWAVRATPCRPASTSEIFLPSAISTS